MRILLVHSFSAALLIGPALLANAYPQDEFRIRTGTMREADFINNVVVEKYLPEYPSDHSAQMSEVAVTNIELDTKGKLKKVVILESPGDTFDQSIIDAIQRWQFKPPPEPIEIESTITFYFVNNNNSQEVFYAIDAPYIGIQESSIVNRER